MTGRATPWFSVLLAAALAAAVSGCAGGDDEDSGSPARPAPVELTADGVPEDLSIGVVVSLAAAPGEGAEWRDAAEGARVAGHRFRLGDVDVELVAVNDRGTAEGAAEAVRGLADQGVSGIVVATAGSHVAGAVEAAATAGIPALLPYEVDTTDLPGNAWLTGPDEASSGRALVDALEAREISRPLLVDAGGGQPEGVSPAGSLTFRAGDDAGRFAARLTRTVKKRAAHDGVVVSGPAELQATVVQALQGVALDLPVFLTEQALSPAFAESLQEIGGSLSGTLTSVGIDVGDPAAMTPDGDGRALSAYFAALRAAAEDSGVKDLFAEQPYATAATGADVRSHDAVVALVRAAVAADSAEPADVVRALSGLSLDHGDGLAGPALDFSSPTAVAGDEVVPLEATPEDPGLRPDGDTPVSRLFWFRAPES